MTKDTGPEHQQTSENLHWLSPHPWGTRNPLVLGSSESSPPPRRAPAQGRSAGRVWVEPSQLVPQSWGRGRACTEESVSPFWPALTRQSDIEENSTATRLGNAQTGRRYKWYCHLCPWYQCGMSTSVHTRTFIPVLSYVICVLVSRQRVREKGKQYHPSTCRPHTRCRVCGDRCASVYRFNAETSMGGRPLVLCRVA